MNKLCRLQVKDAQCFHVDEGPSETVLIGPCGDGVTCQPQLDRKSCAKNLNEKLGVVQDAELPLDLGGLFVAWVGKD